MFYFLKSALNSIFVNIYDVPKNKEQYCTRQLIISKLQEHSRKPSDIRNRIVELCGDLPRIELFARQKVKGWDYWGDQV